MKKKLMTLASAVDLIVHTARLKDGSRKITKITEVRGLDDANQFRTCDLFVNRLRGKGPDGRLIGDLEPTGQQPNEIPVNGRRTKTDSRVRNERARHQGELR